MPPAFPVDAVYQSYPQNHHNGGYYPTESSEVGTPFSPAPPGPGPQDIVIDPALLNDPHIHQVHSAVSSSMEMGVGGFGSSRRSPPRLSPSDIPNVAFAAMLTGSRFQQPQPIHYGYEPNGQYLPPQYAPPPPPMGHHHHQQYLDHRPYEEPQLQPSPFPPASYYPQETVPYSPVYSEPVTYVPPPVPEPLVKHPSMQPPPPTKRGRPQKKRPPREETCSFCQGSDHTNKDGIPEAMVSCYKCGRSGHPSCLKIEQIGEVIRNYDWTCMDCKTCEICRKKGREKDLLFCDMCDRGWHTYCLNPQLADPPTGTWACPVCAPQVEEPSSTVRRSSSATSASRPLRESPQPNGAGPMDVEMPEPEPMPTPVEETPPTPVEPPHPSDPPPKPKPKKVRVRQKKPTDPPTVPLPDTPVSVEAAEEPQEPQPVPLPLAIPVSPARSTTQKPKVRLKFGKGRGRGRPRSIFEDEEPGPYDGILDGEDGDVSKTAVTQDDKTRFESARTAAETRIGPPNTFAVAPSTSAGTPGPSHTPRTDSMDPELLPPNVRPLRSISSHLHLHDLATPSPHLGSAFDKGKEKWIEPLTAKSAQPVTGPSRIRAIRFGEFEIDTWYDAPFPEEYASVPDGMLWICEFCLKYMKSRFSAGRHRLKCKARSPPGDEIYRDESVSIFEIYCQNLCLLSKMFLDHKSLFYDVEPFLFYVMTETDEVGARFIGYFSKEKRSPKEYNLSCIMTLPVRQKKGYGNFLIDFSYLLSKKEGRIGGPETPLSALGALSYKRYRTLSIMYYLKDAPTDVTLPGISAETSMTIEDIYVTLQDKDMIVSYDDLKGGRGEGSVLGRNSTNRSRPRLTRTPGSAPRRRDSRKQGGLVGQTSDDTVAIPIPRFYRIKWDKDVVDKYIQDWEARRYLKVNPAKLKWSPFLLGRSQEINETIDGSSPSTALVPVIARQAEEDAVKLKDFFARLEAEKEEEVQSPDEMQIDQRPERSSRRGSAFIPTKTPRTRTASVTGSITRTRSRRDLAETGSRASRSRAGSDDEGVDDGLTRSSRRLRTRRSESHLLSKTPAKYSLRRRKSGVESNSDYEEVASETSEIRKRPRRRTASAAASSMANASEEESEAVLSPVDGDETEDDEINLEEPDEEEEEEVPRPRNRRSVITPPTRALRTRPSKATPNGKTRTASLRRRHSETPNGVPRKRRRVQSSDEGTDESDSELVSRRRRASRNQAQPVQDVVETPEPKGRPATRRSAAQVQSPVVQTPRKPRRGRPPKRPAQVESDNDAEAEAQVEDAVKAESLESRPSAEVKDSEAKDSEQPLLDFESTGSLSSLGPEPTEDEEIRDAEEADEPDAESRTKSGPKASSVDPLLLLAAAANYVAPAPGAGGLKGSGEETEEMDAEGEEDWS
ncbi:hypothetical protein FRB90_000675 [Tulasnella sp. 427]|nr:hypothetical protein FRB90_000675 [Tulasnella sp. 427]